MNIRILTAIVMLTVLLNSNTIYGYVIGDINGDGEVGLEEALFALQVAAGQHPGFPDTCILNGAGIWETGKTYFKCDVVSLADNFYVAQTQNISIPGNSPAVDSATWTLLPLKGEKGDPGEQGPPGASPFELNNNDAYYVSGNVGFGTSSPAKTVDILGTANVKPGTFYFARGETLPLHTGYRCSCDSSSVTEDCAQGFYAMTDQSGCTDWWLLEGSVDMQNKYDKKTAAPALYVGTIGGVGVGTDSPTERLEVAGRIKVSNYDPQIILHDTDGYGIRPRIRFLNNTGNFDSDDRSDQYFSFYTIFSNNRTFDAHLRVMGRASGSWGKYTEIYHDGTDGYIGTDAGDLVLEPASGNVAIDGNIAFPDGTVQTTAAPVAGMFPRPAYDSGWVDIGWLETKALTHNLGGDPDNYVVDLTFKDLSSGVVSNRGLGYDEYEFDGG
ncbi:MAG: hypothetical protein R3297_07530, partial [Desulfobulbales bacterium]|nr:hypothetical protein [Desulfobulbales bacterium]